MDWDDNTVRQMWKYFSQNNILCTLGKKPWKVNDAAKSKLSIIIPGIGKSLDQLSTREYNIKLRNITSPYLCQDISKEHLIRWIIRDWGGIYRNKPETFRHYEVCFGSFEERQVKKFIESQGTVGISSWSKVLSLALPKNYAIYDSRVAIALNCALDSLKSTKIFVIPNGQNITIKAASAIFQKNKKYIQTFGYIDYVNFLKKSIELKICPNNLLESEMLIFEIAPMLAQNFIRARSVRKGSRNVL